MDQYMDHFHYLKILRTLTDCKRHNKPLFIYHSYKYNYASIWMSVHLLFHTLLMILVLNVHKHMKNRVRGSDKSTP